MANGPMIKVNKEFSFESYEYGWIVHHHKKGVSKTTKEKITVTTQQYFARLDQVSNYIIDTTTKKADSVEEILKAIKKTKKDIIKVIENM